MDGCGQSESGCGDRREDVEKLAQAVAVIAPHLTGKPS